MLHNKSKQMQDALQALKNDQMMLNTFSQELNQTIKNKRLYDQIMTLTRNFAIKKDKDVEEARSAIFSKNHQIGELFNKQ